MLKKSKKNRICLIEMLPNTYSVSNDVRGLKILNAYNCDSKHIFKANLHENAPQDLSFLNTMEYVVATVKIPEHKDVCWVYWQLDKANEDGDVLLDEMQIANEKEVNMLNNFFPKWLQASQDLYSKNVDKHYYNTKYRR